MGRPRHATATQQHPPAARSLPAAAGARTALQRGQRRGPRVSGRGRSEGGEQDHGRLAPPSGTSGGMHVQRTAGLSSSLTAHSAQQASRPACQPAVPQQASRPSQPPAVPPTRNLGHVKARVEPLADAVQHSEGAHHDCRVGQRGGRGGGEVEGREGNEGRASKLEGGRDSQRGARKGRSGRVGRRAAARRSKQEQEQAGAGAGRSRQEQGQAGAGRLAASHVKVAGKRKGLSADATSRSSPAGRKEGQEGEERRHGGARAGW